MNLESALVLVWISAGVFFTLIVFVAIISISSAFLSCRKRTRTNTVIQRVESSSIKLDLEKLDPETI